MESRIFYLLTVIALFFNQSPLHAQDCEVLLEALSGDYSGECRKGRAHGEGIARGEDLVYEGEFRKGFPHGEGTLTFADGRIFEGEWKNGEVYGYGTLKQPDGDKKQGYFKGTVTGFRYMGEEKSSLAGYLVLETERLENATYNFVNTDPESDQITIQIFENNIRKITNFEILEITGGVIQLVNNSGGRLTAEIDRVTFPVTIGIRYIIPYGTQDTTLSGGVDNMFSPRMMRFTIMEPGHWVLNITHR